METKNQILKNLGFSDELIAKLRGTDQFICNEQNVDFEFSCMETEDFNDLVIENFDSQFVNDITV